LPRGCPRVKRALWRGALWWLPNDARSIFGPPGAGKCMVVVVNGLLQAACPVERSNHSCWVLGSWEPHTLSRLHA
jgi:hypothetical protein